MPSGPKKRKAAKRKMESLCTRIDDSSATTLQSGNGSESGGEVPSPTTPEGRQFEAGESGIESNSVGGAMESSENGGKAVEEEPGLAEKAAEVASTASAPAAAGDAEVVGAVEASSTASDTPAVVPLTQSEDVSVEHVEPEKDAIAGSSGVVTMPIEEEELEKSVLVVEESAGLVEKPVPVSEELAVAAQVGDVPVEMVEASSSAEPPPHGKEEKVVNLSDRPSTKQLQPTGTREPSIQTESWDIGNEVILPPQAVRRTSWLSCCGLFDAFSGSGR